MRRNNQIAKAFHLNSQYYNSYGFPQLKAFVKGSKLLRVKLKTPQYKNKKNIYSGDKIPFLEITPEYKEWLYDFTEEVLKSEPTERNNFLNPKLDIDNPGISGFRVYDDELNYLHVQVRKIPEYPFLYQLDYFESSSSGTDYKLTILADVSDPRYTYADMVYSVFSPETTAEYAHRIATTFRSVIVYMRPYEYGSNASTVVVTPFPKNIFDVMNYHIPQLPEY